MKSRENVTRLKRFQVEENRRKLEQITIMIQEFTRMTSELESQIEAEQQRAGISDINHFAYPTFARAARQRCDNLKVSIKDLHNQAEIAQQTLDASIDDLKRSEKVTLRDTRQLIENEVRLMEVPSFPSA